MPEVTTYSAIEIVLGQQMAVLDNLRTQQETFFNYASSMFGLMAALVLILIFCVVWSGKH